MKSTVAPRRLTITVWPARVVTRLVPSLAAAPLEPAHPPKVTNGESSSRTTEPTAKASTVTLPSPTTVTLIVCDLLARPPYVRLVGPKVEVLRSCAVPLLTPSMVTCAEPWSKRVNERQTTDVPVNVKVAVSPAVELDRAPPPENAGWYTNGDP